MIDPQTPSIFAKALSFILGSALFLVLLFIKLCYSTALYSTLAEINRRITVFRQSRRPVLRAILLLPAVVFFCSAVLFILCAPLVLIGASPLSFNTLMNVRELAFAFLRVGFILAAVVLGTALGIIVGRNVSMGRDRFGGVLYANRGRYLAFWLFTFTLCGFFRLMPWGFITYWTIWLLVLAACLVAAAHWTLYGACRSMLAAPAPGLPPGDPVNLSLKPREAVVLSALMRASGPLPFDALGRTFSDPDAAWLAHPMWTAEWGLLRQKEEALKDALETLASKGLVEKGPSGWAARGAALRLRHLGFIQASVGLTVRQGGAARTLVLHRQGPTALLLEPSPGAFTLRELAPGSDATAALLSEASN